MALESHRRSWIREGVGGLLELFAQYMITGITLGGIYVLIATGFGLVYSVLQMINFAHGEVYVFGVYTTLAIMTAGVNPLVGVLGGIVVGGILAATVEFVGYRPLRGVNPAMALVAAVAFGWIIKNGILLIWGPRKLSMPALLGEKTLQFGNITVSMTQIWVLVVAVVIIVSFNMFLRYHRVGHSIVAVSQDIDVSQLMGIPINRVVTIVYLLGGAVGVVGGVLYSMNYGILFPSMGFAGTVTAFTAVIIGGLGTLSGALAGGMVLGIVQSLSSAYLSPQWREAITFALLIIILLVRPEGILGAKSEEERV